MREVINKNLFEYFIARMEVNMGKIILEIIGLIIVAIGAIMIFDARYLTKRFFGFGDQNQATLGFKILGFFIAIVGGLIVYFNL